MFGFTLKKNSYGGISHLTTPSFYIRRVHIVFEVYSSVSAWPLNDKINFSTSIATWLTAVGTIGAVITSLWFAWSKNRLRLKVHVGLMVAMGDITGDQYCRIRAVNIGLRPITITNIGWKCGIWHWGRKYAIQDISFSPSASEIQKISSKLPLLLNHGDEFNVYLPALNWLESASSFVGKNRIIAKSLKVTVFTSTDEVIEKKVSGDLMKALSGTLKDVQR